jgi:hypothetical protein
MGFAEEDGTDVGPSHSWQSLPRAMPLLQHHPPPPHHRRHPLLQPRPYSHSTFLYIFPISSPSTISSSSEKKRDFEDDEIVGNEGIGKMKMNV